MTDNDVKRLYVKTEHGTFTPNYTYVDYVLNEKTQEYEYIGLVIHKTAQEVYNDWLLNKDNPVEQPPNEIQLLSAELSDIEIKLMKLERGII